MGKSNTASLPAHVREPMTGQGLDAVGLESPSESDWVRREGLEDGRDDGLEVIDRDDVLGIGRDDVRRGHLVDRRGDVVRDGEPGRVGQ